MQVITRIGVVSLAKISGMSCLLVGLIAGVIFGGFTILAGLVGVAGGGEEGAGIGALGVGGGLMLMIAVPLAYGLAGFIGGLIYGLIINLVLKLAGGLELEIQGAPYKV